MTTYEKINRDFKVGDSVRVIKPGAICSSYEDWAIHFGLKNFRKGYSGGLLLQNGALAEVVAVGSSRPNDAEGAYFRVGIEIQGCQFVMASYGLQLVKRVPLNVFNDDLFTL